MTEGEENPRSSRAVRRWSERQDRRRKAYLISGVVGEVLLSAGALLALFVVWQLWWTDVEGERAQAAIVQQIEWATPVPSLAPSATAEPEPTQPVPHYDAPPVLDPVARGETFAVMYVPRWGADYEVPVSGGTDREVLDTKGIGHYEGTQMPGDVGNFAIAGHRNTYGKPFHRVEELQLGDPLVIRTEQAWYVYRVSETRIVLPHQVEVIAPVPGDPSAVPTQRMITLTTCHPMYTVTTERFIVHGELDYWLPADDGPPVELLGEA